jgi:predicted lipoprotein with Yx(FWY)xxD motif
MKKMALLLLAGIAAGAFLASARSAGAEPVITRPTLTVHNSAFGRIIWDGRGRVLYAFTADPLRSSSVCSGECATKWPPYIVTGKLRAGTGVNRRIMGTIRRDDGTLQLTYKGRPLYYYVGDPPGRVRCQNVDQFGGLWLVVRPTGALVR